MHLHITPSELLIGMLVVLAAIALLAEKLKIAYPILLVLAGTAMGLVPAMFPGLIGGSAQSVFRIEPEIVFLLFLPPLLYYAGLLTTWRDFKANIRPISQLAVGLVLVTVCAVAVVAHALFPSLSWPLCFLLGAIVSPPDAVAATAVLQRLRVPKRVTTILEGESLVNDATALVAYGVALTAVSTGAFSLVDASGKIIVVALGGLAVGLIASYLAAKLMEKIDAPAIESTLALLVPYAAYIPAEKLGGSGVLAVVAAGIYMGRRLPEIGSPRTRLRTQAVWDSLVFLLNGVIFILIGLQLYDIVRGGMAQVSGPQLFLGSLAICATAIVVRIAWCFPGAYLPRLIPSVRRREGNADWRSVTVVSWAGMRGIVTLAAAFALDEKIVMEGSKQLILFIAFAVVFVTLVLQGLTIAPLIKLLGLTGDDAEEHREEVQARLDAAHAAVSRLTVLGFDETISPEIINRVRAEYDERIAKLGGKPHEEIGAEDMAPDEMLQQVRREALSAERKMITFMRDQNILGDEVLRTILMEIDLEDAKLGKKS